MEPETPAPPPIPAQPSPLPPPLPPPIPEAYVAPAAWPAPVPPQPLGRAEGTLYLAAMPVIYLFGSVLSFLPSFGTPTGYVAMVDQAFNMVGIALLGLLAFGLPLRSELGVARPPARRVLLTAGFVAANFFVIAGLSSWINEHLFSAQTLREQSRSLTETLLVADTQLEKILLVVAMVVGAPIAEELLFRGLLQNVLARWWRPWIAVLVTSIVFTAFHFVPIRFPAVFEIALVLGTIYRLSGSIWLSILGHAVSNGMAVLIQYAGDEGLEGVWGVAVIVVAAVAWIAFGALLLRDLRRSPAPPRPAPTEMRWSYLLLRLPAFWAAALIFGLLAIPLAGRDAVTLQRRTLLHATDTGIDRAFRTDVAFDRFSDLDSAVRAKVKRGQVTLGAYDAWLRSVRDDLRRSLAALPVLDARKAAEARDPLPAEQAALRRLTADAVERFGIAPPSH